jgi:hypothetical protein
MNYLDLLPNDVMKIINRKVEDLRIISRRNERNKNREINIQQKITADRKRRISNKYALLYHLYKRNKQYEYCNKLNEAMKKELGDYYLKTDICIENNDQYIIVYFIKLGELFRIIVYDLDTEAEIEHMLNFNEPSGYHINY